MQISKIRNEKGEIITYTAEIQSIIRDYYKYNLLRQELQTKIATGTRQVIEPPESVQLRNGDTHALSRVALFSNRQLFFFF